MRLKIMTYNIWGCQSYEEHLNGRPAEACKRDAAPVAEVIQQSGADVISLNEVFNCEAYGNQAAQIAKLSGFTYHYFAPAFDRPHLKGYYGNAILSKFPIVKVESKVIPAEDGIRLAEPRSVACATLDCDGILLDVIVSHFGLIEAEKARAVDAVLDFAEHSVNKCVFMGDMNSAPDSIHADRLRKVFRASNEGENEIKTWPVEPIPPEFCTFNSPLFDRQIDHIFTTNGISVSKTEAIYSLVSDHMPLCAHIEI